MTQKLDQFTLITFLKEWRALLDSGPPSDQPMDHPQDRSLIQALAALARGANHQGLRAALLRARERLTTGASLGQALFPSGHPFPEGLAQALAEPLPTGLNLGSALKGLEATYQAQADLGHRSFSFGAILPVIGQALLPWFLIMAVMAIIVPPVRDMYQGFGSVQPMLTMFVLELALLVRDYWPIFLILLVGGLFGAARIGFRWFGLRAERGRFFSLMAAALGQNVDLVSAWTWSMRACPSSADDHSRQAVLEALTQGQGLSTALAAAPRWPNLVTDLVARGEVTGNILAAIRELAAHYTPAAGHAGWARLLVIVSMIGALLAAAIMILAMYLPVFGIASAVGG